MLTEELRHSEEKYRAIFEESRDVILTTNRNAVIDTVNGAVLDLLGYAPLELIGRPLIAHFVRREDGDALLRAGRIRLDHRVRRRPAPSKRPCGSVQHYRRSPWRRKWTRQGFQAIVHDMTAYRLAEAERERSLLLEKEKVKAEAASNAKSDFLATMSHELRTPLNSILGYAQILQDQTRLTTFQRRSVQTILANGRHLLNLIQDVLDLSRIEADRLTIVYADVALHPLLAEVVNAVQVKAAEKGLGLSWRVQPQSPTHIHTDEKRLRQILLNLLSNAVRYTDAGEVALTVACQHNEDNTDAQIRFAVSDTGVGLTQDEIERIFEPFEQAVAHDNENQGLGLGLSISRRLARLLGGGIQVESSPGVGSRFWLDLPCVCDKDIDSSGEDVVLSHPVAAERTDDADAAPSWRRRRKRLRTGDACAAG
ncbi:MAG: ATP-binding protein [Caldilineaceae bacterium]